MTYSCPNCNKELSEQEIIGGICSSCHKIFDIPKEKQPAKSQENQPLKPPESPRIKKEAILTPEEKQRIYEEEKIRLEAQEETKQFQKPKPKISCVGCLAIFFLAGIVLLAIYVTH